MQAAAVQLIEHTNSEGRMEFTIHFRGVAVFVAKAGGNVTEVLFPSAERQGPPNGDDGEETPRGKILGKNMKHADGSDAPQHFAGALIVGPGKTRTYRKLHGRLVRRDFSGDGYDTPGPALVEALDAAHDDLRGGFTGRLETGVARRWVTWCVRLAGPSLAS